MKGYIYKITSPTNRIYVGQTSNTIKRINNYKNLSCKQQRLLYASLSKYGFDNHEFEIIDETDLILIDYWEQHYIRKFNSYNGFNERGMNLTFGGNSHRGKINTPEAKAKMSKAHTGKILSPQHVENIRLSSIGRVQTQETIDKRLKTRAKWNHTEETKKLMSNLKIGVKRSSEFKKERSEYMLNVRVKKYTYLDLETGIYYCTTNEIAISLNLNPSTVKYMLKTNRLGNRFIKYKLNDNV